MSSIPLWFRLLLLGLGAAAFIGSWFIGNTVDAGVRSVPASSVLAKDGMTFAARMLGIFLLVAGLLTWVVSENGEHHHGFF